MVSFIGVPVYYFGAEDGVDKVHRRNLVPMTRATIRIIESVRGQTKASLAAASDDIPKAGYDATGEAPNPRTTAPRGGRQPGMP